MTEYALIVALLALVVLAAMTFFGEATSELWHKDEMEDAFGT